MTDPWRLKCPDGHRTVESREGRYYWCETCGQRYAGEPTDAADDTDPGARPDWPDLEWPVIVGQTAMAGVYHTDYCRYVARGIGTGSLIHETADGIVDYHDLDECEHCDSGGIGSRAEPAPQTVAVETLGEMDTDAVAPTAHDREVADD